MLGKIEGKRRRGKERMRCLGGITGPMDVSLSKLWKSLETLPDKPRQHIKKQRHHFANKVHIVKALVFPVVMYTTGCERWTIKKAEFKELRLSNFLVRPASS